MAVKGFKESNYLCNQTLGGVFVTGKNSHITCSVKPVINFPQELLDLGVTQNCSGCQWRGCVAVVVAAGAKSARAPHFQWMMSLTLLIH